VSRKRQVIVLFTEATTFTLSRTYALIAVARLGSALQVWTICQRTKARRPAKSVVAVMRSPFRRLVSGSWMGAVLRGTSIAGQEKRIAVGAGG
jgi:hypothetical protein